MARITIEDCLENVDNMYELVHLATKRSRQLFKGAEPLVKSRNRVVVTALREIASGRVVCEARVDSDADVDASRLSDADVNDLLLLSN